MTRLLLSSAFSSPEMLHSLDSRAWEQLFRLGRQAGLLTKLLQLSTEVDALPPEPLRLQMEGDATKTTYLQLQISAELRHLSKALSSIKTPIILMKGAAYLAAEHPTSKGRRFSDIDILVAQDQVEHVESCLKESGWQDKESLTTYDEHYYREWSHEIPPLHHPVRGIEVDLHHNIIEPISRFGVDAKKLLSDAIPIQNSPFWRLCDEDQFLHSATHLLTNDELRGGFRDLLDMRSMLLNRHDIDRFKQRLIIRACELGLQTPLYYALRLLEELLDLATSNSQLELLIPTSRQTFKRPVLGLMKATLAPESTNCRHREMAKKLLLVRAFWNRMPLNILCYHLAHKMAPNVLARIFPPPKGR